MEFSSKLLENLVYNISQLTGIGKRSALRIALEILKKPTEYSKDLSDSIREFRDKIVYCNKCHNISDKEIPATPPPTTIQSKVFINYLISSNQ